MWDLTAGKLLHDFKFHEGPIRSIDFHPLEFLLATGEYFTCDSSCWLDALTKTSFFFPSFLPICVILTIIVFNTAS